MAIGIRFSVVFCAVFCLGITSAIDDQRLLEVGTQCGTQAMQGIDFASLATQEGQCDLLEKVVKCILREVGQITGEQLQQVEAIVMQNNNFQCDLDIDALMNEAATGSTGEGDSASTGTTVDQQKIMQVGQQCALQAMSDIDPNSLTTNEAKCDYAEKVIKCILKQVGPGITQEQIEQFESTMDQDPSDLEECDWTVEDLMDEVDGNTDSGDITMIEFVQAGQACSQEVFGVSDPGTLTHEQRCNGLEDVLNCLILKLGAENINDMMIMALKKGFSSPDKAQCDVDVRNVIQQATGAGSTTVDQQKIMRVGQQCAFQAMGGIDASMTGTGRSMTGIDHSMTGIDPTMTGIDPTMTGIDHSMTGIDHSMKSMDHSVTGINPSMTSVDHSMTGITHSMTARDPSVTGINPSMTVRDPSMTGINPSMTGIDHSMTGMDFSMTGINPSMTVIDHGMTVIDHSMTAIDPSSMGSMTIEAKCNFALKTIKCILKQVGPGITQEQIEQFQSSMMRQYWGQRLSDLQCDWTLKDVMAGKTDSGGITMVRFSQAGHACAEEVYGVSDPGTLTHEKRCDGFEDVLKCLIRKVGAENINDMMIMALKKGFSSPEGAQCDVDVRDIIQQAKGSDSSEERCEKKGYYRKDGECVDVNECIITSRRNRKCTGQYEECYNTPGSFQCHCAEYYLRDDDDKCTAQAQVIQQCNPDNIMPGSENFECSAMKKVYKCVLPRFDNQYLMDRWAATRDSVLSATGTECDFTASEMAKQIQKDKNAAVRAGHPVVVMLGSVVVAVFLTLC